MRLSKYILIAVFWAFVTVPLGSLILFGYSPMAEQKPLLETVKWKKFAAVNPTYRDQVLRQAVIGSPAGMLAITALSAVDYNVLRSVNAPQVVSGSDGWLFYKEDFIRLGCFSLTDAAASLSQISVFADMASAIGIETYLSVSPDKSTVYTDKLKGPAGIISGCKSENGRWRKIAASYDFKFVDHLEALNPHDSQDPLYWRTDTHWTSAAQRRVLDQWREVFKLRPIKENLERDVSIENRQGDLTKMLRLSSVEAQPDYTAKWNVQPEVGGLTWIAGDSFYRISQRMLDRLFKSWAAINIDSRVLPLPLEGMPKRIVINTVERNLVFRTKHGGMRWDAPLPRWLIETNAQHASANCLFKATELTSTRFDQLLQSEAGLTPSGDDPKILINIGETIAQPCIRISFDSQSRSAGEVFLPTTEGHYVAGRSFEPVTPSSNQWIVQFVLPSQYSGGIIRFDPPYGSITNLKIEVGTTSKF